VCGAWVKSILERIKNIRNIFRLIFFALLFFINRKQCENSHIWDVRVSQHKVAYFIRTLNGLFCNSLNASSVSSDVHPHLAFSSAHFQYLMLTSIDFLPISNASVWRWEIALMVDVLFQCLFLFSITFAFKRTRPLSCTKIWRFLCSYALLLTHVLWAWSPR